MVESLVCVHSFAFLCGFWSVWFCTRWVHTVSLWVCGRNVHSQFMEVRLEFFLGCGGNALCSHSHSVWVYLLGQVAYSDELRVWVCLSRC